MAADEEFRKVAEDVRGLARALQGDLRTAKWEAKAAARDAKRDWREYRRTGIWPARPTHGWGAGAGWGAGSWGAPGSGPGGWGPGGWMPPGAAGPPQPPAPGAAPMAPPPPVQPPPVQSAPVQSAPVHSPPVRAPKPARPAGPPVRHKRDGSTLISLLLVLVGLAWLGSASGIVSLSLETVLATVLVVLGAVMVITARTDWSLSRKPWPMLLGLVVLVLVMASANSGGLTNGVSNLHVGPMTAGPATWADATTPMTNFAGPITLDLSGLTLGPSSETLRVRDVFGPISVTLPARLGYHLHIRARTSFGPVSLPPNPRGDGGMFTTKTADLGPGAPAPTLTLELTDAFGPITVRQPIAAAGIASAPQSPFTPATP